MLSISMQGPKERSHQLWKIHGDIQLCPRIDITNLRGLRETLEQELMQRTSGNNLGFNRAVSKEIEIYRYSYWEPRTKYKRDSDSFFPWDKRGLGIILWYNTTRFMECHWVWHEWFNVNVKRVDHWHWDTSFTYIDSWVTTQWHDLNLVYHGRADYAVHLKKGRYCKMDCEKKEEILRWTVKWVNP